MKVHIITVQNSLNYGAFLQAFALMKVLEEMDYEVDFINTHSRKPYKRTMKQFTKNIFKLKLDKAQFCFKLLNKYRESWKSFKVINENRIDNSDIVITGSDEIWNVHRKECADFPIFWANGVKAKVIISYAPSCNITKLDELKKLKYPQKALEKYNVISVRDEYSKELIEKITDKNVEVVLDPTMLLKKEDYKKYTDNFNIKNRNKYILIYSYGEKLKENEITKIKEFAKKENLEIVAAGLYNKWVDKNVAVSPFEFLKLIDNAQYVITDTFHGTIFSILYHKQFITYTGNNNKVKNLVKKFGLEKRDMYNNKENIENLLRRRIEYDKVDTIINSKRDKSLEFLRNSITGGFLDD